MIGCSPSVIAYGLLMIRHVSSVIECVYKEMWMVQ